MSRSKWIFCVPPAVTVIAAAVFGFGAADSSTPPQDDCGCSFTDAPLTEAELLALPSVATAMFTTARAVTMHVDIIQVSWTYAGGVKKRPSVRVRVVDDLGTPLQDATVKGDWSGCFKQNDQSGITGDLDLNDDGEITDDEQGWAYLVSSKTASCPNTQCYFTFTVTDVSRSGDSYDASQNAETTDFAKCNPFNP